MKKIFGLGILILITASSWAQDLQKNKFTITPFGIGKSNGFGSYKGASYERYLDRNNHFSVQMSFDKFKHFKAYEYSNMNLFGLGMMYHFSPKNKFQYSIGVGYEYGRGEAVNYWRLYGWSYNDIEPITTHSIMLPQRFTWNVNKRFFVALEAKPMLSFINEHTNNEMPAYRDANFKFGSIHLGIKF